MDRILALQQGRKRPAPVQSQDSADDMEGDWPPKKVAKVLFPEAHGMVLPEGSVAGTGQGHTFDPINGHVVARNSFSASLTGRHHHYQLPAGLVPLPTIMSTNDQARSSASRQMAGDEYFNSQTASHPTSVKYPTPVPGGDDSSTKTASRESQGPGEEYLNEDMMASPLFPRYHHPSQTPFVGQSQINTSLPPFPTQDPRDLQSIARGHEIAASEDADQNTRQAQPQRPPSILPIVKPTSSFPFPVQYHTRHIDPNNRLDKIFANTAHALHTHHPDDPGLAPEWRNHKPEEPSTNPVDPARPLYKRPYERSESFLNKATKFKESLPMMQSWVGIDKNWAGTAKGTIHVVAPGLEAAVEHPGGQIQGHDKALGNAPGLNTYAPTMPPATTGSPRAQTTDAVFADFTANSDYRTSTTSPSIFIDSTNPAPARPAPNEMPSNPAPIALNPPNLDPLPSHLPTTTPLLTTRATTELKPAPPRQNSRQNNREITGPDYRPVCMSELLVEPRWQGTSCKAISYVDESTMGRQSKISNIPCGDIADDPEWKEFVGVASAIPRITKGLSVGGVGGMRSGLGKEGAKGRMPGIDGTQAYLSLPLKKFVDSEDAVCTNGQATKEKGKKQEQTKADDADKSMEAVGTSGNNGDDEDSDAPGELDE